MDDSEYAIDRVSGRGGEAARGATLVLVLLVMLGISAMAVTALNSVSRSVEHSGVFRVRTQASQLSSSVAGVADMIVGSRAKSIDQADVDVILAVRNRGGSLGDTPLNTSVTTDYSSVYSQNFFDPLFQGAGSDTEGLLADPSNSAKSFEDSLEDSTFSVAIERSYRMKPDRGGVNNQAYRRVVVYSRGQLGEFADNWRGTQQQVGVGRHVFEAKVGPIQ